MATNTGILDLVKPAGNENALISVINSNMDKVDAEAGRARGNIAANYSTSSAYDVGDLCIYQGNLYRCNTAIASGEEWTAAHWTQVNIAGELDSQKQDITSNTQAIANIGKTITNGNLESGHLYSVVFAETALANSRTTVLVDLVNTSNNVVTIATRNWQNTTYFYTIFLEFNSGTLSISSQYRVSINSSGGVSTDEPSTWSISSIRLIK